MPIAGLEPQVQAALITAAAALAVGVLTALGAAVSARRARQRDLYSRAYRTVMAWEEMLYRVRRRRDDDEAAHVLIDRFHELQEEIAYFSGWIRSESLYLGRSYCRLVDAVKGDSEDDDSVAALVQKAWEDPIRAPAEGTKPDDKHPKNDAAAERFLTDVKLHLSLWSVTLIPYLILVCRNPKNPKQGDPS